MTYEGQPCGSCSGSGGKTTTAQQDGKTVQVWVPCGSCSGRGRR